MAYRLHAQARLYLLLAAMLLPAQYPKSEDDLQADLAGARSKARIQSALVDLDQFYEHNRNWNRQAEILKQLVDFWKSNGRPDSIGLARYSADLGCALERVGDGSTAEQYLRSAIAIFAQKGPLYSSAAVAAKRNLIAALLKEDKFQEADELKTQLPRSFMGKKTDQHARLISKQEPLYTDEARKHFVCGSVSLSLTIDETGRPRDVEVIAPLGFGLDENAIKTVEKWRFAPATSDGLPVASHATIQVSFRLLAS